MNRLEEVLKRLREDEKELSILLEQNRNAQYGICEALGLVKRLPESHQVDIISTPKKRKQLVAEKLGNNVITTANGKETILSFAIEALTVLEEPLTVKIIHEYVEERRKCTYAAVYQTLIEGLKKGVFKRIKGVPADKWALNEVKDIPQKRNVRKGFTRPNYGISKAIAEFVSDDKNRGAILTPSAILTELKSSYPQDKFREATETTVQQAIENWIREGKPGIEKKQLGSNETFIFKQPIKV